MSKKRLPGVKGPPPAKRKIPAWGPETLARRLHRCVTMLAIHGYLPDSQSRRIHERINDKNPK